MSNPSPLTDDFLRKSHPERKPMNREEQIKMMKKATELKGALMALGLTLRIDMKDKDSDILMLEELMEIKPGSINKISSLICETFKLPLF